MAAKDEAGERRRTTRSLDERKRIVEEALASGALLPRLRVGTG